MKKQTRIYNVLFPIWIIWLFPQVLAFVIPGNLVIDCAVLFFTLLALKHRQKGAVVKKLWWKFWLLGFAADLIGAAWMFLGWQATAWASHLMGRVGWLEDAGMALTVNPFRHPLALLWTLAGVALAGVCIYLFDRRAMKKLDLLTDREKRVVALTIAIVTAPWLFLIPIYL